jgi:hypothetical protein
MHGPWQTSNVRTPPIARSMRALPKGALLCLISTGPAPGGPKPATPYNNALCQCNLRVQVFLLGRGERSTFWAVDLPATQATSEPRDTLCAIPISASFPPAAFGPQPPHFEGVVAFGRGPVPEVAVTYPSDASHRKFPDREYRVCGLQLPNAPTNLLGACPQEHGTLSQNWLA